MKKVILALVCLLLINSCGFEIPKSITIKGEPGLYVPLGSPFAGMNDKDRLENLISPEEIKKMIVDGVSASGNLGRINVYEASNSMVVNTLGNGYNNVLTYLVEYQLADMPLNLQTYMDQAIEALNKKEGGISIPDIPPEYEDSVSSYNPRYVTENGDLTENEERPFLRIPLNDMRKLVKEVKRSTDGKFGLKIPVITGIKDNLQIRIPALGINDYIYGTPEGNDLLFVDESGEPFVPREQLDENGDLLIYARISGACEGTIVPEIVFDWETAKIDTEATGNSAFKEEYPIGNSLGKNFPIKGVSLNKVSGYVYMSGIGNNNDSEPITMTVGIANNVDQVRFLQDASLPSLTYPDGTVEGSLTTSSFTIDNNDPLELAPVFENDGGVLKVEISIPGLEISHDENIDTSIKCKLFVLIPLVLNVSDSDNQLPNINVNGNNIKQNYVPLDFDNSFFDGLDDTSDLFGRKDGDGEENIIDSIEYVKITLQKINITIIAPKNLAVLINRHDADASNSAGYQLLEFTEGKELPLYSEFIKTPFIPKFTVLLKKGTSGIDNPGSLRILRTDPTKKPAFDFNLDVTAKTALEYKIKL